MATGLSKIEIITSFAKYSELQSELNHLGVRGMTVMQVMGCGIQKGTKEFAIKENAEIALLPKQQINLVVETKDVDNIVEKVKQVLYTGHIGDGKIFSYDLDNAVRIRTREIGLAALN